MPKSPTFLVIFVKVSKSIIFLVKSFLGNFYRHLPIFLVTLLLSYPFLVCALYLLDKIRYFKTSNYCYLSVLEAVGHCSLVVLDPERDEIGGTVKDAFDRRQGVDRRDGLLQEVAAPGNSTCAAPCLTEMLNYCSRCHKQF